MLALGVISVGICLVNVSLTTCITSAALCAVVVSSLVLSTLSLRGISVCRASVRDGFVNGRINLALVVRNRRRRNRQAVVIQERLPFVEDPLVNVVVDPLLPQEERLVPRTVVAARRGYYKLNNVLLFGGDPAGFFRRTRSFTLPDELVVYPETVRIPWMPVFVKHRLHPSATERTTGIAGLSREFFGVREYRPSDGFRFIHWKASAKHRRLMTREYESHNFTQINILLDVDRRHVGLDPVKSNFEYLIMSAASICEYLAATYCEVLFVTIRGADRSPVVIRGNGKGMMHSVANLLAVLEPCGTPVIELFDASSTLFADNSILYCLTMSEEQILYKRFDALLNRRIDTRWIFAPPQLFPRSGIPRHEDLDRREPLKSGAVVPYVVRKNLDLSTVLTYG